VNILERRMSLMESQLESIEGSVRRIAEVTEFHHALEKGEEPEGQG
jgi:hypothetical protein